MTKSELIARLVEYPPQLSAKDTNYVVKVALDTLASALASGRRVEIRGFGSFSLNLRPARVGRNPKSGEKILVPEKRSTHFKPGKELRKRVNVKISCITQKD